MALNLVSSAYQHSLMDGELSGLYITWTQSYGLPNS